MRYSILHPPTSVRKFHSLYLYGLILTAFVASTISACSPFYVLRAAYEEGKILWRREAIANYLQNPEIALDAREKLQLVLDVRDYARDQLGLNVGGSYASYSYVDRPDLSFVLTAAPTTELKPYTWWFLIVGRVPYKGYFSRADAEAAAADLQANGYDTSIRPTAAFSTLGWFDDPLLGHLLRYDKTTLAEVVFHELFHNTLYIKGAGAFNESVANFVGARAAIDFFRVRFGEESAAHQRALEGWEEELEFSAFIEQLGGELKSLYGRDIPLKEKLGLREATFARAKQHWAERVAAKPSHRFRNFPEQPLNNAVMVHLMLYLKELRVFEDLYETLGSDLKRAIGTIQTAVKEGGEPFAAVRRALKKLKEDGVRTGKERIDAEG